MYGLPAIMDTHHKTNILCSACAEKDVMLSKAFTIMEQYGMFQSNIAILVKFHQF
jgi:hypothetical protein